MVSSPISTGSLHETRETLPVTLASESAKHIPKLPADKLEDLTRQPTTKTVTLPHMSLTEFEKMANSRLQRLADRSKSDTISSTLKTVATIGGGIVALVATAATGPIGWAVAGAGLAHLIYRHYSAQKEYRDNLWQEYDPVKLKALVESTTAQPEQKRRFSMALRTHNIDLQIEILKELDPTGTVFNLEACRRDENSIPGHASKETPKTPSQAEAKKLISPTQPAKQQQDIEDTAKAAHAEYQLAYQKFMAAFGEKAKKALEAINNPRKGIQGYDPIQLNSLDNIRRAKIKLEEQLKALRAFNENNATTQNLQLELEIIGDLPESEALKQQKALVKKQLQENTGTVGSITQS